MLRKGIKAILSLCSIFIFLSYSNELSSQKVTANKDIIYTLKDSCISFKPMRNDSIGNQTRIINAFFKPFHANATLNLLNDSVVGYCDKMPNNFIDDTIQYQILDNISAKTDSGIIIIKKLARNVENVWSGDVNNDGVCNNLDVLFWANVINKKGLNRYETSTLWHPTAMTNNEWKDTTTLKTFTYYADANGDADVNFKDVQAIYNNYGKTHPISNTLDYNAITDFTYPVIPVELEIVNKTLSIGDTLNLKINVGKSSGIIQNISGIAFTIEYDTALFLQPQKFVYSSKNSWLTGSSVYGYSFVETQKVKGQIIGTETRLGRLKTSGGGEAGDIKVIIEEVIIQAIKTSGKDLIFTLKDVSIVGGTKDYFIRSSIKGDTLKNEDVIGTSNLNSNHNYLVKIEQNSDQLLLTNLSASELRINIYNSIGEEMAQTKIKEGQSIIPIENLCNGLYHIHIKTLENKTLQTQKILINH